MELLPCPFCGSNEIYNTKYVYKNSMVNDFFYDYVYCVKCESIVKESIWNSRHSPWISVQEKLPNEDETVLVSTKLFKVTTANLGKFFPSGYAWYGRYEGFIGHINSDNVTHWMPLPSSPENKQ